VGALLSVNSFALVIDFTAFGSGDINTNVIAAPEAIFTSLGGDFYIGAGGITNSVCALNANQFNCEADIEAVFTNSVQNLTLETGGYGSGDTAEFFAYDSSNTLLGSVVQSSNGLVDLSAFSGIKKLFIDDSSTAAGFSYGNWTFDYVASVPAPGTFSLLAMGLVGLGLSRKRKAK